MKQMDTLLVETWKNIGTLPPKELGAILMACLGDLGLIVTARLLKYLTWPTNLGEIITSKVASYTDVRHPYGSHSTEIVFKYMVNQKKYTSKRNFFMVIQQGEGNSIMQRRVEKYPVGKELNIIHQRP